MIPRHIVRDDNGILRRHPHGTIWVPPEALSLRMRIIVASHGGELGHRGCKATQSVIREDFWWEDMSKDIQSFVQGCLLSAQMIPRPLGHALRGSRPNEVLHLDYLFIGKLEGNHNYIPALRDDFSSYVWLWATNAATAVANWIGCFGTMTWSK